MYAPAHPLRLAHEESGSGSPVVLLHGLGGSRDLWRHQVPDLVREHRVVTLDLRGHGASPLGAAEFTIADMAQDVARAFASLGIDRATVVGLSMGGGVAQALAIAHPHLVRALVLVSTSSEFPASTRRRFLERAEVAERDGMEAVIDVTVPRWFTTDFADGHPDEVDRARRVVLATEPDAFAAASRANAARNFGRRLQLIGCPVLFIGGEEDPADPRRAIEIYRRELRRFRAELIAGASHLVPVEAPGTFNALLLGFLAEQEADTTASAGGAR